MKIAILGATGYIGRSLVHVFLENGGVDVVPFSRDAGAAAVVFQKAGIRASGVRSYAMLDETPCDVLINATGLGSPRALAEHTRSVFAITESMDAFVFRYLEKYPTTRVFSLSSGAIYGLRAGGVPDNGALASFNPRSLRTTGEWYAVAKLASEAKHRAYSEYAVVDLRVFSFFSRFVDVTDTFLLSQMVAKVRDGSVLTTSGDDMVRDYCTAQGLMDAILFFCAQKPVNMACDLVSRAPVRKFALLDHFAKTFGLRYEVSGSAGLASPTGSKNEYYSLSTILEELGYAPRETSLEGIHREMKAMYPG